jgi:hypothetical protein
VYREVSASGEPGPGWVSVQRFKGRLPYLLTMTSEIKRYDPPHEFEIEASGDLRGRGVWSLSPRDDGRVHVRFDWRVYADRALLRVVTPLLRPLFRANHNYAISRAKAGLEPYAQSPKA